MKAESTELNILIGKNIRTMRETRGYSQEYLALKAGVDQSNIHRLESGRVEIKLTFLLKICSILDISIYILLLMSDLKGVFTNSSGELQQVRSILIEILNSENLDERVKKELVQRLLNE